MTWQSRAACWPVVKENPARRLWWFPEAEDGSPPRGSAHALYQQARKVCDVCSVRAECLDYALTHNQVHGMWAGLSPMERKKLVKKRRAA